MITWLNDKWNAAAEFFENGDLTPVAVLISIAHYGPVLAERGDNVIIAWMVGALIDLLHFRSVRRAANSLSWLTAAIAAITTAMAVGYHLRFYDYDLLLALPIPIGIAILAQHAAAGQQEEASELQTAAEQAQALAESWQARHDEAQKRIKELQEQSKNQQAVIKAWQTMNEETQALVRYNAKQVTAEQAAAIIGVKDVRTVQSRAQKLNGATK